MPSLAQRPKHFLNIFLFSSSTNSQQTHSVLKAAYRWRFVFFYSWIKASDVVFHMAPDNNNQCHLISNKYTVTLPTSHPTVTIPVTANISLCIYITVHVSSSLTRSSVKSFSDNWLGQPQSSHLPRRMKENDIKTKWEWPLGVRMALQWRNPSPARDSLDISSPEDAPGRRLTSPTTLHHHSSHYQTFTPRSVLERNTVTDMKPSLQCWVKIWHQLYHYCMSPLFALHPKCSGHQVEMTLVIIRCHV